MSPKTAGRRASAVGKSIPAGSSLARSRRGTARMTAATKNEDGASEGMGIPNSPTTLSARGRRTRTVVNSVVPEEEEDDGKPANLEVLKTPATRPARGRRAVVQAEKSSIGEQAGGGDAAVLHTPAATTARRASTRRITRSAAQPEEASGARTSRYRTRMSSRKAAADQEAPEMETETVAKGMARVCFSDHVFLLSLVCFSLKYPPPTCRNRRRSAYHERIHRRRRRRR